MAAEPTLTAFVEKRVVTFGGAVSILAAVIPLTIDVARIDPAMDANKRDIADLRAVVAADRGVIEMEQDLKYARVDRIEEARSVDLPRLTKVEEAVQITKPRWPRSTAGSTGC